MTKALAIVGFAFVIMIIAVLSAQVPAFIRAVIKVFQNENR